MALCPLPYLDRELWVHSSVPGGDTKAGSSEVSPQPNGDAMEEMGLSSALLPPPKLIWPGS